MSPVLLRVFLGGFFVIWSVMISAISYCLGELSSSYWTIRNEATKQGVDAGWADCRAAYEARATERRAKRAAKRRPAMGVSS